MTVDEYNRFFRLLELEKTSHVLDIACGSGYPSLYLAKTIGCGVIGIDINGNGIAAAKKKAKESNLDSKVDFKEVDAGRRLPFNNESFDAAICVDSLIHLSDRLKVLKEWRRVLKPGGRLLFTDPTVITGLVSHIELATRSSIGYFLFAPPGEDERLIKKAGLRLLDHEDLTQNMAKVSKRWHDARRGHKKELVKMEGHENFEGLQRFLLTVHSLASERRLSRFLFVSEKIR
jgi:ubiquinone/menaquinone biosynthesis C-methylase UbiE